MKQTIKIFTALLFALNVMPGLSAVTNRTTGIVNNTSLTQRTPVKPEYITVSGTVTDNDDNVVDGAIVSVAYQNGVPTNMVTKTNASGHFTLDSVPSDTVIIVSGSIYERKIIPVAETMIIKLNPNSIAEISIEDRNCTGITGAVWSDDKHECVCKQKGQEIRNRICVDIIDDLDFEAADKLISEAEDTPTEVLQYENEKAACKRISGAMWDNGKCVCEKSGYVIKDTKCVKPDKKTEGKECSARHGTGKYDANRKCILEKCNDDSYTLNKQKNTCEKINTRKLNRQECEKDTSKKWKNGECVDKCDSSATWDEKNKKCICEGTDEKMEKGKCVDIDDDYAKPVDTRTDEQKAKDMQEKQNAYETARDTEQSNANKILTATSTAATGIGGMELAQGLSEQRADKAAEQSMSNYIATMRCKYGDTQVKAGLEEIELPGGNDSEMAKYRTEYFSLAADLRERKTALGMAAGIESEEILDKSTMGLYTQENVGISDGAYASLYRAQMYNSENDKTKINEAKETSKTRVVAGATAAGIGVVGGIIGDRLINNEATERIARASRNSKAVENTALNKLKSCLTQARVKKTDELQFKKFKASALDLSNIDCEKDLTKAAGKNAQDLFEDSEDGTKVCAKLKESFGDNAANEILAGCSSNQLNTIVSGGSVDLDARVNGLNARALDMNNTCAEKKKNDVDQIMSPANIQQCSGLSLGQYEVEFDYGVLSGISKCAETTGKVNTIGNPTGDGDNCWCRATTLTTSNSVSNINSNWVSLNFDDKRCAQYCAHACAGNMLRTQDFREALFGTWSSVDTPKGGSNINIKDMFNIDVENKFDKTIGATVTKSGNIIRNPLSFPSRINMNTHEN